jgi:hypothetical protein
MRLGGEVNGVIARESRAERTNHGVSAAGSAARKMPQAVDSWGDRSPSSFVA